MKLDNSGFQEICIEDYNYQICDMKSIFHSGKLFLHSRLCNVYRIGYEAISLALQSPKHWLPNRVCGVSRCREL